MDYQLHFLLVRTSVTRYSADLSIFPSPGYPGNNLTFKTGAQYAGIDNVFNIVVNCSTLFVSVCVMLCFVHVCLCVFAL